MRLTAAPVDKTVAVRAGMNSGAAVGMHLVDREDRELGSSGSMVHCSGARTCLDPAVGEKDRGPLDSNPYMVECYWAPTIVQHEMGANVGEGLVV